jgi:hypothetical protein
LVVCFAVPESSNDLEAVVDGVAAAAALTQNLAVFESGDDMFDAGPDAADNDGYLPLAQRSGLQTQA